MPTSLWVASVVVAGGIGGVAWVLATMLQPNRSRVVTNLNRGFGSAAAAPATVERAGIALVARSLTPEPLVSMLAQQYARAGRPKQWTVERLLVLKLVWVPVAAGLVFVVLAAKAPAIVSLTMVAVSVLVYFMPDLLLLSKGQERDTAVQRELADTLDQMTIAVEAGLGFDAALTRVASNGSGALSQELARTLQDMRIGLSRRQAFEDLAERIRVDDLRAFVRAVLQADAFGISIGDVLRTQASEMRLKRRQRAEEQAQQVPVKVLFPLMFCILPVLFIVIMAPAVMSLVGAFSGAS